jgi:hypothetical protein
MFKEIDLATTAARAFDLAGDDPRARLRAFDLKRAAYRDLAAAVEAARNTPEVFERTVDVLLDFCETGSIESCKAAAVAFSALKNRLVDLMFKATYCYCETQPRPGEVRGWEKHNILKPIINVLVECTCFFARIKAPRGDLASRHDILMLIAESTDKCSPRWEKIVRAVRGIMEAYPPGSSLRKLYEAPLLLGQNLLAVYAAPPKTLHMATELIEQARRPAQLAAAVDAAVRELREKEQACAAAIEALTPWHF